MTVTKVEYQHYSDLDNRYITDDVSTRDIVCQIQFNTLQDLLDRLQRRRKTGERMLINRKEKYLALYFGLSSGKNIYYYE